MANRPDHNIASARLSPERTESWRMFDRIARRYDLLNRLLSAGRDVAWRRRLARFMPAKPAIDLLDVATGTGDVLLELAALCPSIRSGRGVDLADNMLAIAGHKIRRLGFETRLSVARGDASALPCAAESFDCVTIAFGIRNVVDVPGALAEMKRVLRPGGRLLVLEFSLPSSAAVRTAYLWYFRHVLPRLGGLISGDSYAYRYLNETVETFPYGEEFCSLLRKVGFVHVEHHPMTAGIATIYVGDTPKADDPGGNA